jgi:hypothetical protein
VGAHGSSSISPTYRLKQARSAPTMDRSPTEGRPDPGLAKSRGMSEPVHRACRTTPLGMPP